MSAIDFKIAELVTTKIEEVKKTKI